MVEIDAANRIKTAGISYIEPYARALCAGPDTWPDCVGSRSVSDIRVPDAQQREAIDVEWDI